MRLYGNDACTDCKIAKMLFKDYGIDYVWVDVSDIVGFEGDIPQVVLDDGRVIIGLGKIKKQIINV